MNLNMSHACIFFAIVIAMSITKTEAEGDVHCPDVIRDLVRDACRHLQRVLNEERENALARKKDRTKREIDYLTDGLDEPVDEIISNDNLLGSFTVRFLPRKSNETVMTGELYNARRSSDPEGAHLILHHRGAKMLRQSGSKYRVKKRPTVNRGVDGKLVKDHTNRHRRYTEHSFMEKMVACCHNDKNCLAGYCLGSFH